MPGRGRDSFGVRRAVADIRSDGRGGVLLAVSVGWFLVLGVRLVVPALLPHLTDEFGLSLAGGGSLYSLLLLVAAFLQFPSGVLCDRHGGGRVLLAGFLATFGGVVLVTVASALPVFVLGIALFGVGTGTFGTPRVTVISETYDDREATALGVLSGFGNAGTSILPVVAGAVTVAAGWRAGFGLTLPLFLLTVVAIHRYVPVGDAPGGEDVIAALRDSVAVLRARDVLLATVVMTAMFFVYQGLTGMLVSYLVQVKGFGQATAASVFGLFFVGGIGAQLVAGGLGDRFGPGRALAAVAVASAGTTALLPFATGFVPVTAVVVLMSVQLGVWPLAFAYATGALPAAVQAGGLGLQRTVYLLLAAPASAVVGAMGDLGRFDAAFLGLAAVAALAAVVCLRLPRQDGTTA